MSLDSWDPSQESADSAEEHPDASTLQLFIRIGEQEELGTLSEQLDAELISCQATIMRRPMEHWNDKIAALSDEQLIALIRFFTIAEQQLPGWEAAEKSPVIAIVKQLKKRKNPPTRSLVEWIRAHSDNRFLPNGPL